LADVNTTADADDTVLRLSLDAKLTPFGILLPQSGEVFLYFTE